MIRLGRTRIVRWTTMLVCGQKLDMSGCSMSPALWKQPWSAAGKWEKLLYSEDGFAGCEEPGSDKHSYFLSSHVWVKAEVKPCRKCMRTFHLRHHRNPKLWQERSVLEYTHSH